MSSILNKFAICEKIPQKIKSDINLFYIFNDYIKNKNIIFVTKDDKVYGLGHNYYGILGLGNNRPVAEITEIKELSHKKINELFIGENHVLGRTEVMLIGWGKNEYGQLGRGYTSKNK